MHPSRKLNSPLLATFHKYIMMSAAGVPWLQCKWGSGDYNCINKE